MTNSFSWERSGENGMTENKKIRKRDEVHELVRGRGFEPLNPYGTRFLNTPLGCS